MSDSNLSQSDDQSGDTLAVAIGRISDLVARHSSVETVVLAIAEESRRPGADARAIKLFGKNLFEAMKLRDGRVLTAEDVDQAIEEARQAALKNSPNGPPASQR